MSNPVIDIRKGKRQCTTCFEWKPKSEFWGNAKRCKKCDKIIAQQRRDLGTLKRRKERIELFKLIGDTCFVCNGWANLFHEKYGRRHPLKFEYYKEHYEDFVPLCSFCHPIVHSKRINLEKVSELRKMLGSKNVLGKN